MVSGMRHVRGGIGGKAWVVLAGALCLITMSALGAEKDWNREIQLARLTKWDTNATKSRQMAADKLIAIASDNEAPIAARRAALQNACDVLKDLAYGTKDPAAARKIIALCDQHDALPPDTNFSMIFAAERVDGQLALLSLGQKEALPDALAALDKMAALYAANPLYKRDPLTAEAGRGQAYLYAGDAEKAAASFETFFSKGGVGNYQTYVDAIRAYKAAGQDERSLAIAADGVVKCNGKSGGELVDKAFAATLTELHLDDKLMGQLLPKVAGSDVAIDAVLKKASKDRSADGDLEGALAYAKLAFDVAPIELVQPATEWLTRCLKAKFMDAETANAFVNYLNFGPAGRTGAAEPADSLKNPLADVKSPLAEGVKAELRKALAAVTPSEKTVYTSLKERGTLHLLLGEADQALSTYAAAYRAAGIDQMRQASGLVPRALKARDGSLKLANQYLEYQKNGPGGADGKAGTKNPLPASLPPLSDEVQQALRKITQSPGSSLGAVEAKAFAWLALGDCKKGFWVMKAAFAAADVDDASQARVLKDMAAAIKAYDGHVVRANEYLAYQSRGATGKDGKTQHVAQAKNPLPEILKEVGL